MRKFFRFAGRYKEQMTFKTKFVLLTFPIALFASGPIAQLIAHGRPYGNSAWAQDAIDADVGENVPSEPAVAPPNVQGAWAGTFDDPGLGIFDITLDFFQNKSKLVGTFKTSINAHGTFKGKIASNGTTITLKFRQKHHPCSVTTVGTLIDATDMEGTYKSKHCGGLSSGNFSVSKVM
jgi:hypothetical protein